MTNYRSRIADELLRASHGIVYRRIWRGLADGALPDDTLTTTISALCKPSDRRERRIGQRRTIYSALWTLYNLCLIDVKTSGQARLFRYHICLLPVSDHHEEQLLFALRRAAAWGRKRRSLLVHALEHEKMSPEIWGHVAPDFCGDQMTTQELIRPGVRQLVFSAIAAPSMGGFPHIEGPRRRVGDAVFTTSNGYVVAYAPDHPFARGAGYVLQHRLVMESMLGRHLLPSETVHHKNGIRHDNRPENLELWTGSHPHGVRSEDLHQWAKNHVAGAPLHTTAEGVSVQRSMEQISVCTGTPDLCSGMGLSVQRKSLDPRSGTHCGCQIDICGCSSGSLGKEARMSEWEGVDELPDGGTSQSRWGKRKLPSRKMKPSYVAPSVDEPTAPPPVQKKAVGRPITADLEIDTNTWAPAAIVLPIIEDLFREKIEVGRSGVIFFYSNDTPPKAFLRELTRVETSDTFAQDPRVTQETVDGPIAVARILQHFYRLHDGRVADAHAVSNAHYLVDRLRDYSRNACRLSSLQMAETLCGYAYTASCRVAEGKVEFLPSRSPERIWSRQGYYSHTTTWEGLVARGLASDPWSYLESLPDGCCSLKQKTDTAAKESSAQGQLRSLLISFESACRQHNWEADYDVEHGAGAFKALPMVERVQLVLGIRSAAKYELLTEETTNDSSTPNLGAP